MLIKGQLREMQPEKVTDDPMGKMKKTCKVSY